jgi:predicted nucleotidyltransferase
MKAVGIIVEYNPFHNGHLYHLQETKKQTGADCIIAVMSGNFLQRGEPALVSKWARTKMALSAGVDIVIELPYAFAVQSAERFANGAVTLLHSLFCEEICFGSESGNITAFIDAAKTLLEQKHQHDSYVQEALQKGVSYPRANAEAWKRLNAISLDLSKPNNVLGLAYVKAILQKQIPITPRTIRRIASDYHDETFSHPSIASATSLRKALQGALTHLETIAPYIPAATKQTLEQYYDTYGMFHEWEAYFPFLKYRIMTTEETELRQIAGVDEGIEYRLKQEIIAAPTFSAFMNAIKTKRYTWTRLQRICAHILTNFTKEQRKKTETPTYIRLLGMSSNGRHYLQHVKKRLPLPLVTKVSTLKHDPIYQQEKKAAFAYAAIFPEPVRTNALKEEYATPPIQQ